jgi:hypothetical protein
VAQSPHTLNLRLASADLTVLRLEFNEISYVDVSTDAGEPRPIFETQMSTVSDLANRDRSVSEILCRKRLSTATGSAKVPLTTNEANKGTKLMQIERAETGRVRISVPVCRSKGTIARFQVKMNVYFRYFQSMSSPLAFGFIFAMLTNSALSMGRSIWLSHWCEFSCFKQYSLLYFLV